jgi:hypothetical protein
VRTTRSKSGGFLLSNEGFRRSASDVAHNRKDSTGELLDDDLDLSDPVVAALSEELGYLREQNNQVNFELENPYRLAILY